MLLKVCCKCGAVTQYPNRYCEKCQKIVDEENKENQKAINKRYDTKRDSKYVQFYKSDEWKILKEKKLMDTQYMCEECQRIKEKDSTYKVNLATEVHHVETLKTNWNRRLDYTNLKSLCHRHHDQAHNRFGSRKKKGDE